MQKLSFAVIGAGPAGFYISKCLSKLPQEPVIHIFEKEYCPFGLIRYGVAPDHVSIKKTEKTLSSIASYPHFRYFGNHSIDKAELTQLKQQYSGIIFATGAQKDNKPSWFPTIDTKIQRRIFNSREIVYWYNNHPQYEQFTLDLSKTRDVVIIGNGNVAIDISRIFLKTPSTLQPTQISPNALHFLKRNAVTNVMLVARRGSTNSAFALKELRELTKSGVRVYCFEQQLEASMTEASNIQCTDLKNSHVHEIRMNKRKADFLRDKCSIVSQSNLPSLLKTPQKKVILRFLLDPVNIEDQELTCAVTKLQGEPFYQRAIRTEKQQKITFDMLINSTGFKVQAIEPEAYDPKRNCILNSDGCVLDKNLNKVEVGQYAVGWCKSGPKGVIDQTLLSCEETFNNIRIHVNNQAISVKNYPIWPENKVNFQRYLQLKELELSRGNKEEFIKKKLNNKQVINFFQP